MNANSTVKFLLFCMMVVVLLAGAAHPLTGSARAPEPVMAAGTAALGIFPVHSLLQPSEPLSPDAPCGGGGCQPPLGGWQTMASLPAAVYGAAVVSDGVYVYAAGGSTGSAASSQFVRYDPVANIWTSLAPLPTAYSEALGIYALGKIYILGGEDSSLAVHNTVQVYDIASNTWGTAAAMPDNRYMAAGGYYNGRLFVAGGYTTSSISSVQLQTWTYAINTNAWSMPTNMPAKVGGAGYGVIGNHLYVMGGRDNTNNALSSNYDLNLDTLFWATDAALPTATNVPGSVVYRKQLWIFGGGAPFLADAGLEPESANAMTTTQIYDPVSNTWLSGPAQSVARSFQGAAVVRNRIVSVGGYASAASATVEMAVQDPLKVLILYADSLLAPPVALQTSLMLEPGVGQVDLFSANTSVAPLAQLSYYDLVVAFSNVGWHDNAAQGDALADYLDLGGVVVATPYDWSTGFYALAGRWASGGYSPYVSGAATAWRTSILGAYTVGHPLMAGVTHLNGFWRLNSSLTAGTTAVALWDDSIPLVAIKNNVVGVNAYLGSDYNPKGWDGNFAALSINAGYLLRKATNACVSLTCPRATVIKGSLTATDATMVARLNRSDPTSTCAAPKSCPGTMAGSFSYDTYYYYNNTSATQCVSVTADATSCGNGNFIHVSAYSQFNPASLCTNYLADIGGSPDPVANPIKAFSFNVPAFSNYTLVVNQAFGGLCPAYTLTVKAGACPALTNYLPAVKK